MIELRDNLISPFVSRCLSSLEMTTLEECKSSATCWWVWLISTLPNILAWSDKYLSKRWSKFINAMASNFSCATLQRHRTGITSLHVVE